MADGVRLGRYAFFEHRADEVDAPARRFLLGKRAQRGKHLLSLFQGSARNTMHDLR